MIQKIFKIIKSVQQQVVGINQRNIALIYPHNAPRDYAQADDKVLTKATLQANHIACAPTYGVIENISTIEQIWATLTTFQKMAIKPANGSGGGGIMILKKKSATGQWKSGGQMISTDQIFKHFADILVGVYSLHGHDRVLIEYCIEPHQFFHEIYPSGVPDFRIILLKNIPILAMLRVPTKRSGGKANLHQGGLGIGIDLESGHLTQAYDGYKYHNVHPDSGSLIKGKEIPSWSSILELAVETAQAFPLDYVGVDIALDQQLGPLVMELNVRPGLGIQLVNRVGLKQVLRNYPNLQNVLSTL